MKIAICMYPFIQGDPVKNLELAANQIREAAETKPDLIILPPQSLTGFASERVSAAAGYKTACDKSFSLLTKTAPDVPIIGTHLHAGFHHIFLCHNNDIKIIDNDIFYCGNTSCGASFGKKSNDANNSFAESKPVTELEIRFSSEHYAKKKDGKSVLPENILTVHPLGLHDCGKKLKIFDGSVIANNIKFNSKVLSPEIIYLNWENGQWQTKAAPSRTIAPEDAIIFAIREFFSRQKLERLVIGLSGGIDSALNLLLYTAVLGKNNILAINMPSVYTSTITKNIAEQITENMGITSVSLPIQAFVDTTREQLNQAMADAGLPIKMNEYVFENVQARDRGARVLAGLAAMYNAVFPCNTNKTELTVGYGTLYGDIAGVLTAIGDLWKFEVYDIARRLNQTEYNDSALPTEIFSLKPSAELSEKQNVEKGLGDPLLYPYHDYLFRFWTEFPYGDISETLQLYDEGNLEKTIGTSVNLANLFPNSEDFRKDCEYWWRLYRGIAVAKRLQAPPVISLTGNSFSTNFEAQGEPLFLE